MLVILPLCQIGTILFFERWLDSLHLQQPLTNPLSLLNSRSILCVLRMNQIFEVGIRTVAKKIGESTEGIGGMKTVGDALDEKNKMEWIEGEVGKEDKNEQVVTGIDGLIIQLEKKKKEWESANSLSGQFAMKMLTRIRNEADAIKQKILMHDQAFVFNEHEMDLMPENTIDPEAKALETLKELDTLLLVKKEHYSTGVDRLESEEEKTKFYHDYESLVLKIVDKVHELSLHYQPGTSEYLIEKIDSLKPIDQIQEETGCLAVVLRRWRDFKSSHREENLHIKELFISLIIEKLRLIDCRMEEEMEKRMESSSANPALKWMRDLRYLHYRHWRKEVNLWLTTSSTHQQSRRKKLRHALHKIDQHWNSYPLYSTPDGLETYRVVYIHREIRSNRFRQRMAPLFVPGTEEDCPLKDEVETMECIVCR